MTDKEMYIEAVAHWDDIWWAFKGDNVEKISNLVDIIFLKSGGIISFDSSGCVYCDKFWAEDDCEGCPLSIASGEDWCYGTPYYRFYESPSADTALAEREFIRKHPPADVKIMGIRDIRKQRSSHETK